MNPLLQISPAFLDRLRDSGEPRWRLALVGGFPRPSALSALLRLGVVVGTTLTIDRLCLIADALYFPREDMFVVREERR